MTEFKDLTISNVFMFAAVMEDPENCRGLLEMVLEFPIARIEVSTEKSIIHHPRYHGVRLDVYARGDDNTRYNVEMQVRNKDNLPKRSRYYHSQIDMELISTGTDYKELPDTYVIFICNFDPFGFGKYKYTFDMICTETGEMLDDGARTIFLSTRWSDDSEVPEGLRKFLRYVAADTAASTEDFGDDYVRSLQKSVLRIKSDREMGERYMLLKELLSDEKAEGITIGRARGKAEDVIELLSELGEVSAELSDIIMAENDVDILSAYHKAASKAESVEKFRKETGL
ncbi:MAG: Rpn family recombination-promoting nuclease/putative transposase [Lachnospiraceae bacterium]